MYKKKKTAVKGRWLAILFAAVFILSSVPLPAYAQDIETQTPAAAPKDSVNPAEDEKDADGAADTDGLADKDDTSHPDSSREAEDKSESRPALDRKTQAEDSAVSKPVPRSMPTLGTTFPEVYLDYAAGSNLYNGATPNTAVRTLEAAMNNVQEGGTIYVMSTLVIADDTEIDGKNTVFKLYPDMTDNIIQIRDNPTVKLSNFTFDGGNNAIYWDFISVEEGDFTLENSIIKNYISNTYGAAIATYSGTTVTLKNSQIINNKSGLLSGGGANCGGITVAGGATLNVLDGSVISGNQLYSPANIATDIIINKNGSLYIDGSANIGTLAFEETKEKETAIVHISSKLQNPILMRMQKSFGGTILLPNFILGDVLAEGSGGYMLTSEDIQKITLSSPSLYVVKQNTKKEAYVDTKEYQYIVDPNMTGGTITPDSCNVGYNKTLADIKPVPAAGYQYVADSIYAYEEGKPKREVDLTKKSDGTWTLKMPETNVVVTAEFEKIPPVEPNITVDLPSYLNTIESESFLLQATVSATDENTLSYQWYKDDVAIDGATDSSYKVDSASKSDEGVYYVKATNTTILGDSSSKDSNKCTVKVAKKIVEVDSSEDINGKVGDSGQLWNSALTQEEKEQYEGGTDASVYLRMIPLTSSPDEQYINNILGDKQLGSLLDISVFKKMGDAAETAVAELSQEVEITIDIPENLRAQEGKTRTFSIIRVHEDESGTVKTAILPDLDDNADTITFKTKLFSTYALIYDKTPVPPSEDPDPGPDQDINQDTGSGTGPGADQNTGNIQTGDNTSIGTFTILCLFSCMTIIVLMKRKRITR